MSRGDRASSSFVSLQGIEDLGGSGHQVLLLSEPCVEAGFLFDQIVEHIAVDIAVSADHLPGGLGVGDSEVGLFLVLELSEFDGVGVAGVEDDLDDIDFVAAADVELESVLEIHECMGTEKSEGGNTDLMGYGLGDHLFEFSF